MSDTIEFNVDGDSSEPGSWTVYHVDWIYSYKVIGADGQPIYGHASYERTAMALARSLSADVRGLS